MGDPFYDCHPAVNFLYFAMVITFSMCLMHPVCLVFSLVGAMWYTARLRGGRALRGYLRWIIPMMVMAALVNPAFVHQGVTLLAYLPSGNPLTLESILYGLAAACMLAAVALFEFVNQWNMYTDTMLYNAHQSHLHTLQYSLSNYLAKQMSFSPTDFVDKAAQQNFNLDSLRMAMTIVTCIPILIVYPFLQRYFIKGIMVGSIKG